MKAAVKDAYGSPDVVHVEDVPLPEPGDGDVLVRIAAASVNRADLDGLSGRRYWFVRPFTGLRRPRERRIGSDAAGVVEAVGSAVSRFKPGDRVYADLFAFGSGAFAEYAKAPERAWAPIPDFLSFEEAATLPHSAILAIQGLRWRDRRTPGPGDKVLIEGASGNVGPFAVQMAKALGAEVTGTCRTEKIEFVRTLGADHVIDYTRVDTTRSGERYDWILDTDGHKSLFRVRHALRPGGSYVTLGGAVSRIFAAMLIGPVVGRAIGRSMNLMMWWKPFNRDDLAAIEQLIAAGKLRPAIDRRYPLSDVSDALRWVDDGHARGKVLVIP